MVKKLRLSAIPREVRNAVFCVFHPQKAASLRTGSPNGAVRVLDPYSEKTVEETLPAHLDIVANPSFFVQFFRPAAPARGLCEFRGNAHLTRTEPGVAASSSKSLGMVLRIGHVLTSGSS